MSLTLFALWAVGGWCGTPWPGWWRGPRPHPDPDPWFVVQIIGVVAGVIGGWIISQITGPHPEPWRITGETVTATTIRGRSRVSSQISTASQGEDQAPKADPPRDIGAFAGAPRIRRGAPSDMVSVHSPSILHEPELRVDPAALVLLAVPLAHFHPSFGITPTGCRAGPAPRGVAELTPTRSLPGHRE